MCDNNYPSDWILKVGNLKYDNIINELNLKCTKKDKNTKSISVLLCLQYSIAVAERWTKLVVKSILQSPYKISLIIKPHPQNIEYGEISKNVAISEGLSSNYVHVSTKDIFKVLPEADIVVVHSSTVGIDALFLGIPLAIIDESGLENDNQVYLKAGVGKNIRHSNDLSSFFSEVLNNEFDWSKWESNRKKLLKYHLENLDGRGIDRIIKAILEYANKYS